MESSSEKLDWVFKEDCWCLTSTGQEFIFTSMMLLLDFMENNHRASCRPIRREHINGILYMGFKILYSEEMFLISHQDLEKDDSDNIIVQAMKNDSSFIQFLAVHFDDPKAVTLEGILLTAKAWCL